jgi:hypothetical protein
LTREKKKRIFSLPPEWSKELRRFVSKTSEKAFDSATNIFGVYINKKLRVRMRKRAEHELMPTITNAIQIAANMQEEIKSGRLEATSPKERFYFITDQMRPFFKDVPKNVHVMDACFQAGEEIKDFRFEFSYLKNTKYENYIERLGKLLDQIAKANSLNLAYNFLFKDFKDTHDAYILLQATFQKLINHYEFLEKEPRHIKKGDVDKYLEIYEEMSGHFEKCVFLIVGLVTILLTGSAPRYYDLKKRRLHQSISFLEKHKYEAIVSGFNRFIRNAIAHKSYKVDLVNESVGFLDADKEFKMSFTDLQNATRELSANLLIMVHIFVLTFCLLMLQFKDLLDKLDK